MGLKKMLARPSQPPKGVAAARKTTMQKNLITVQSVSKKFCRKLKRSMWYGLSDLTSGMLGLSTNRSKLRPEEFWALKDVSFELKPGECLGLIGRNGAGKSTLLKMLNGLIQPDEGSIHIRGKVGALIELGAGFNPILSGIENIYINGQILGFSKKEIDQKLEAIAAFAEIDEFLDTPVQNYSSGMRARLGFAVAAQMEPDILLVDEVLAVGDMKFRAKCYRRITELKKQGTAIILVSHNTNTILSICDRALYLRKGKSEGSGTTFDVMAHYEEELLEDGYRIPSPTNGPHNASDTNLKIESVFFTDEQNTPCKTLWSGAPYRLNILLRANSPLMNIHCKVKVKDFSKEGVNVMQFDSKLTKETYAVKPGHNHLAIDIPYWGLGQGLYGLKVILYQKDQLNILKMIEGITFRVKKTSDFPFDAFYHSPHSWSITYE